MRVARRRLARAIDHRDRMNHRSHDRGTHTRVMTHRFTTSRPRARIRASHATARANERTNERAEREICWPPRARRRRASSPGASRSDEGRAPTPRSSTSSGRAVSSFKCAGKMMTTTGGCVREETARPRGTDDGNIVARDREDDRGGAARWEARSRAVMGRRRVFKLRRDGARDATTDECTRRDSIVGDTRRLD